MQDAAPIVAIALDDPQWRVRHAATRALGAQPEFVRQLALSTTSHAVREACRYILGDAPGPTRDRPLPLDDDPAVAAARLQGGVEALPMDQLVALLADPHETLRAAAEARLAQLDPEAVARAALPWLDEPRAAEASQATRRLLEDVDPRALATETFATQTGRGQLGWAAAALVESGELDLVRAALLSPLEAKRGAAVLALLGEEGLPEVALSLTDRYLVGRLLPSRATGLLSLAPAPGERVFDFDLARAQAALERNEPIERRAAAAFLVERRDQLGNEARLQLAHELAQDDEPDLRAMAVPLADLRCLLRLDLDVDPGVRSLAAQALEGWPLLAQQLTGLVVHEQDTDVLRAAWQWIARLASAPLDTLKSAQSSDERVSEHLAALLLAHGEDAPARPATREPPGAARLVPAVHPRWRALGATALQISPLVLSGANDLNVAGFTEAAERGINTFFWEADATSTTRFLRGAAPECRVVTGSYHSGAGALRRDVETALRRLGRERLDVFLLFWTRSIARLSNENLEALEQLRAEGKISTFGFSTHLRDVALEAISTSRWPVVMTRLSLAHPGAETSLLPRAQAAGTGVFTFTSTCYGRLLRSTDHTARASAQECYQFALDRPGVSAAVVAPRTLVELEEALRVLDAPPLTSEREAGLRAHGRTVKESSSAINHFLRHVPSTGRAAFPR
jgi:hypothetical protein